MTASELIAALVKAIANGGDREVMLSLGDTADTIEEVYPDSFTIWLRSWRED